MWLHLLLLEWAVIDAVTAAADVWLPVLLVLAVAAVALRLVMQRRKRPDMSGPVRTPSGRVADISGEGAVTSTDRCPDMSVRPDARS